MIPSPESQGRHLHARARASGRRAHGGKFSIAAVNELGETAMATPAISEGTLFFRTRGKLIAIGAGGAQEKR